MHLGSPPHLQEEEEEKEALNTLSDSVSSTFPFLALLPHLHLTSESRGLPEPFVWGSLNSETTPHLC